MTLRVSPEEIVSRSASPLLAVAHWWERCRLGDIAEVTNGAAFKSTKFNTSGDGLPLIRIRDVGQPEASTHYSGKYESHYLVQRGDLLIGMDGDFRIARWDGVPSLLNQRVCRLRLRSSGLYSDRFLEHVLQPYLDEIHKATSAVTVKHLSSRTVSDLPIPLPPFIEQERIVAAIEEDFSRLDFAEIALEAARSKLRALRRSVLAAAFSGRLTSPTHTTNTDLGQIPEGWRWTALHDLLEHTIGGAWGKPIGEDEVNVRVLRVTEFGEHTVLEPETGVVRAVSAKQLASRKLQRGDILLEKSGGGPNQPVGRVVAFRTHLAEPAVPTNFVQLLRPSRDAIDPAFLTWTLDWWHKNGTAEAHQRATTNIRNLQTKAYLAQPVAVPPRAEQEQVVATIEEHFSVLNAAETALDTVRAKVSACRRSVLVEAFAGRLVPQDPGDESAIALLARIAAEHPVRPTSRKRSK